MSTITNEFLEELNKLIAKRDECVSHLDMFDDVDLDDFCVLLDYDNWLARRNSVDSDIRVMFDKLHSDDFVEIIQEGLGELI
jgi:hypothetical protein